MTHNEEGTTIVTREIGGATVGIGTDEGEIFIDLPINRPIYIRVREGDHVQEGDVRARGTFELGSGGSELASTTLQTWVVEAITPETVTVRDLATDEPEGWDREECEENLATGVVSTNLTDFERVSVVQTGPWDDEADRSDPHVTATAYGDDGRKFSRTYRFIDTETDALEYWHQDRSIETFDENLAAHFERRIEEALTDDGYAVR
ncbi:hypothetical protein HAPAU_27640 [Halalkalicoccus paucihalophilus]|uniref:Uncharacterized protein n=1 Tax=Halalkalicoccus paucihalophilus TaxID=1008153 RepID=A0A151ACA9_9EURY|nr:hypothetical protein [Halalkalicoccus paucihalophilus]KYH25180.1 hypothetical protein HAPAU_27640 [Halalkalicoccus paucihalophilus]